MKLSAQQANKETAAARDRKWENFLMSVDDTIQQAVLNGDYTCNIWAPNSDFARRIVLLLGLDDYKVEYKYTELMPPMGSGLTQEARCLAISWK